MKLMVLIGGILMAAVMAVFLHASAKAELPPAVRIVLVQTAGSDAKYERIDIQNLASDPVDLTGWKFVYKSASGGTVTPLVQIVSQPEWHVLLDAGGRESFISKELAAASPLDSVLRQAEQFAGGMNPAGGGLQLLSAEGAAIDVVGWGTATEAVRQGGAAAPMTATTWLIRQAANGNNATDFTLQAQDTVARPPLVGSLYDIHDVCGNLSGIQPSMPAGYQQVEGNCVLIDVCPNVEGVQLDMPEGMERDGTGACQAIDVCVNLDGIQQLTPEGYVRLINRYCELLLPTRLVIITEVLPNPSGGDEGNEFIELYNGDTEPIPLSDYYLVVGEKVLHFPSGATILPSEYATFSDGDLGVSLPNTTGVPIWLVTNQDIEVASMPAYSNAKDDVSWALVDGQWRYTYAPTPAARNIHLEMPLCESGYIRDELTRRCRKVEVATAVVAACRDGQYRSDETGRCRTIPVAATLTPCRDGQYRSEETNRCRSLSTLISTAPKPCADDQFRNPLTNRCKAIASNDDIALADCGEGRERNPATNRCRNIVAASTSSVPFAVEPVEDAAAAFVGWWAMGGIGALALGYAGWEWRQEIRAGIEKAKSVFTSK